ncbi:MAG: ribose-5-phosphate isomerase RpiA [Bacteroidota bacterium]
MNPKQIVGEASMAWVQSGMKVGLGTGSTSFFAIQALGKVVEKGLEVVGVATSQETERIAAEVGIPILSIAEVDTLDLYIDGADEVDSQGNLIKGGGGALFREKRIATIARQRIIIVDESKVVPVLGAFPLPLEVVPFGWQYVAQQVRQRGGIPTLREEAGQAYRTDNGNYILDCQMGQIPDPKGLHDELKALVGVVETGLFTGLSDYVVVGMKSGQHHIFEAGKEVVHL